MSKNEFPSVQDYWKFTRDLKAQLNVIKLFERQFFEYDDLCEWSIRNGVTVFSDKAGKRITAVDDCLGKQQSEIYMRLLKEVRYLEKMLVAGLDCFDSSGETI